MRVLFDTSAIAKRYRDETGRADVEGWLGRATEVVMAAHCRVEVAEGLCRDVRDGMVTTEDLERDLEWLDRDFADFSVVALDRRIEALAVDAMARSRLRATDALHIATAGAAGVAMFITADRRQADAARAFGLATTLVEAA